MNSAADRRRSARYAVTLSAKITCADRTHRVAILDVSAGGLLLSIPRWLDLKVGRLLDLDATLIGRFRARVVDITDRGIHLEVETMTGRYEQALGKLSDLARTWP